MNIGKLGLYKICDYLFEKLKKSDDCFLTSGTLKSESKSKLLLGYYFIFTLVLAIRSLAVFFPFFVSTFHILNDFLCN